MLSGMMLSGMTRVTGAILTVERAGGAWRRRIAPATDGGPRVACRLLCRTAAMLAIVLGAQPGSAARAAGVLKSRADEWITECNGSPGRIADCSITVPFWQTGNRGKGSFALVVMLQTGNVGIVGQPFPVRAVLRIDKNQPIECRQTRYCIFPASQAPAIVKQLEIGSLILVDVFTANSEFSFSLTAKGYQAGVAQIRAWGFRLSAD